MADQIRPGTYEVDGDSRVVVRLYGRGRNRTVVYFEKADRHRDTIHESYRCFRAWARNTNAKFTEKL